MSERSHKQTRDWRAILKNIYAIGTGTTSKQVNAPLIKDKQEIRHTGSADDPGILGDEAFELDREKQAMEGWGK